MAAIFALPLLGACSVQADRRPDLPLPIIRPAPQALTTVRIEHLSDCSDDADESFAIDRSLPVTVIVHGCYSSSGQFRTLASVFAMNGQQAICFNYDDRDSLETSSAQLIAALEQLAAVLDEPQINLIGHSQGGLVARRALISERPDTLNDASLSVRLTTISAPFGGIDAASHCGLKVLTWLSFGLIKPICRMITGMKYREIPPNSRFINEPGTLIGAVQAHVQVVTDEADTCRRLKENGDCAESDFVFSIDEQTQTDVEADERVTTVVIAAGHVEIVGDDNLPPDRLISVLQNEGVMRATPSAMQDVFAPRVRELYRAAL